MIDNIDPAVFERVNLANGGNVAWFKAGDEVVAVKNPIPRAEYKRFRSKVGNDKTKDDAAEQLLRGVLLYPDAVGFDAMLDRKPALADVFGGKVLELAGLTDEVEAKK